MASNDIMVEETIIQATSNGVFKVHEGDYNQLRQAANLFLQEVNKISQINHNILSCNSIKEQIKEIYNKMRDAESNTQKALQLQHIFETQINDFMGRTIYLTYVDRQGNLNIYDDANIGKLYSMATVNKGRGNISASKMFDAMDVNADLKQKLENSIKNKAGVFRQAVSRWESDKNQLTKDYDPSKNTFYWRLYDYHISGWTNPIATRGIIAEGYAGAVINEDFEVDNNTMEYSLKALYEKHIDKDSIGGAIKGDVVLKDDGQIQFAIKSGSFSTAMFGQYVRLAYNILQIQQLTPQQFENALPALVNFRKITNQIIEAAALKGEQEITFMIGKQKYSIVL